MFDAFLTSLSSAPTLEPDYDNQMRLGLLLFLSVFLIVPEAQPQRRSRSPQVPFRDRPLGGIFTFFGDTGMSVIDTLSQTTQFAGNVLTLDFRGAFNNITGVVSKKNVDRFLIQLVTKIPEVLEKDLHLRYRPTSTSLLKTYFIDNNLDTNEAAAMFSYLVHQSAATAAERNQIVKNIKKVVNSIKEGSGLNSRELGRSLGESMEKAIEGAPVALPLIGNPVAEKRQIALIKGFVLSLVDKHGVALVKSNIRGPLAELSKAGISIEGLDDQKIAVLINRVWDFLGLGACLETARSRDALLKCEKLSDGKQTEITGLILETLRPWLNTKEVKITFSHSRLSETIDVGAHLGEVLRNYPSAVERLKQGDAAESVGLVNLLGQSVAKDVGTNFVASQFHRLGLGESDALKKHSETLVNNFVGHLELLPKGTKDVVGYFRKVYRGAEVEKANSELDRKLRVPFSKTLAMSSSRQALFDLTLLNLPFTAQAREKLHEIYREWLSSKSFSKTKAPIELQSFVRGFDAALDQLSKIPANVATISYLKNLVEPKATEVNLVVGKLKTGAVDFFKYLMECGEQQSSCQILTPEFQKYIEFLHKSTAALKGSDLEKACESRFPQLLNRAFEYVERMDSNVLRDPFRVLNSFKDYDSQEAVNCVIAGAVARTKLPVKQVKNLHAALEESLNSDLATRAAMIDDIQSYLFNGRGGQAEAQKSLLTKIDSHSKGIVKNFADRFLNDFKFSSSGPVDRIISDAENFERFKGFVHKVLDNTDFVNESTALPLETYAQNLLSKPLELSSPVERALKRGISKTLQDPELRKQIFDAFLDAGNSFGASRIVSAKLSDMLREAYMGADLTHKPPRFPTGTPKGFAAFLSSFDAALQELPNQIETGESLLEFARRVSDPKMKFVDKLVADQGPGVGDLILSLVKCEGVEAKLCGTCLGTRGSWLFVDPKTGLSEVLVNAPAGQVLELLKIGLMPSASEAQNDLCAQSIPALISGALAEPLQSSDSILNNPTLVLDVLARPAHQTALNCIVSNYAEAKFLKKIRNENIEKEAMFKAVLRGLGIPSEPGLFMVSGESVFETLQKYNSNKELLKEKFKLVESLKAFVVEDKPENRLAMAQATASLTRMLIAGGLADPAFSQKVIHGFDLPKNLVSWALNDSLGKDLLACIDRRNTDSVLPVSLFLSEELVFQGVQAFKGWLDTSTEDSEPQNLSSGTEACSGSVMGNTNFAPLDRAALHYKGAFRNSFESAKRLHQSQGYPFPALKSAQRVNYYAGKFQEFSLHERTLKTFADQGRSILWHGNYVYSDFQKEALAALGHYRENPSKNAKQVQKFIKKHCGRYADWEHGKPEFRNVESRERSVHLGK